MDSANSPDEYDETFDSGDEENGVPTKEKRKPYNDQDGMETILKQMQCKLDWLQHLDVTSDLKDVSLPGVDEDKGMKNDIEDDFKREMVFYCQAQVAAKEALKKLRDLGVTTERPEDYFAEMVKTDTHMQKIRQKLLDRKQGMEKSEKAKKQRQLKKVGKKVQQEVIKKRQEEKKKMLQTVDRIKKGKGKLEDLSKRNDDDDDMFNVSKEGRRKNDLKRKRKDEKFGFGGKKRKIKKNSKESSADLKSFKPQIHSKGKNINPKKFGNKNAKPRRLGKSRRMQSRAKK